ncbi:MAG TPA: hypothetical protein VF155_06320 [Candidatus Dormibacteraeota bacterium]
MLDLHCPSGCEGGEFELLNAQVIVDRGGRYVRHSAEPPTYVCSSCQSVAVDLAAASRELHSESTVVRPVPLRCPSCGLQLLPPAEEPFAQLLECPACETRFGVEEGTQWLHGGPGMIFEDGDF